MLRAHRAAIAIACVVAGTVACSAVLGLDAPKLDPCADVACADGGDAGDAGDAAARPDGPIVGVRCGGGSFGVTGCSGATPVCCQTSTDGGAAYACVASAAACTGFPIACASYDDCSGSNVCCHSSSQIRCVGQMTCANADLVCEPDGAADQCPAGWTCSAAVVNAGVTSPYFGCMP